MFRPIVFVPVLTLHILVERIPRTVKRGQDAVPIIYVNGSHYDIGHVIGQTFGKVIQDFLEDYGPLEDYLRMYETSDEGKRLYKQCLESTELYFPQYLVELKGMADGAGVPFHKLFLIHLDDILTVNVLGAGNVTGSTCSTIIVNIPTRGLQIIGQDEDVPLAMANRFYIVNARVKPRFEEFGGMFDARDEQWQAMTYAGWLPGHASGHNVHGLVFTVNPVFVTKPIKGKIPRAFLTRALLASRANIDEIQHILTNQGIGTANGFRVNAGFLDQNLMDRVFYSIEVTPLETQSMSNVDIKTLKTTLVSFHANRLNNDQCSEMRGPAWNSSETKETIFTELMSGKPIQNVKDMLVIMGAIHQDAKLKAFRDTPDDMTDTINLGVFDFIDKTWTIWTNNSNNNPPIITLSLQFSNLISPVHESISLGVTEDKIGKTTFIRNLIGGVSDIFTFGLSVFRNIFKILF